MKKIIKYTNYIYAFCSFTCLLLGICLGRIELIYVFVFLIFAFIILAIIETRIEENYELIDKYSKVVNMRKKLNYLFFVCSFIFLLMSLASTEDESVTPFYFFLFCSFIFLVLSRDLIFNVIYDIKCKIEKLNAKDVNVEINEKTKLANEEYELINSKIQDAKIELHNIKEEIKELTNTKNTYNKLDIEYIDKMEGLEFEEYVANLLKELGYINVTLTPASGDFGIDVVAERDNVKYAFQCKNYNSALSNKCVQEAFSGKQFYNCHVGVVITNNYFTNHAKELANKNGILLWDRDKLINLLNKVKEKALT